MANTFKNFTSQSVGTTQTTVYTVPASSTSVVIGLNLANRTGSTITADVLLGSTYLIKGASLPAGVALSVLDGKIIIEESETISVVSSAPSSLDVILSTVERS